jgi:bifunctional DNA-binding transcriptional regulator/antitoxin component of YhaV-PrlF toxin-antitoxin module
LYRLQSIDVDKRKGKKLFLLYFPIEVVRALGLKKGDVFEIVGKSQKDGIYVICRRVEIR